jgi:hypothetical protein
MAMTARALRQGRENGRARRPPKTRAVEFRDFTGGINLTDSRTAIKDTELAWAENIMPIGSGALQMLNAAGPAIATLAQGISSLWGLTLNGAPVFIAIGRDGSLTQVTPGGVQTAMGGVGTVSAGAGLTSLAVWQGTTLLILDPVTGYRSWDGATLTLISAAQVGDALAVFQGRAWLIRNRTITFTAPNTFNDFSAANGAGSTILTDEAFPGNINAAVSAVEQLWLVGDGAVEALSNVTSVAGPPVVTTFSLTNIVTKLGSNAQHSVIGYFRALAFLAPFGAHALSGVTPQKITEKLDRLFPALTITRESCSAAVAVVQNLLCLLFRVTYTGQQAQAGPGPRSLILVFNAGRWCFASQGDVTWITDVLVDGVAQAWGTDGASIFRLFGAPDAQDVTYKAQGKLSAFGTSTTMKACLKTGLEFESAFSVDPVMTIDNETAQAETANLQTTNDVTWVNQAGEIVTFVNQSGQPVTWVAQGQVLSRQVSNQYGRYLGWTLQGTHPVCRFQAVQMEVMETTAWATPGTAG